MQVRGDTVSGMNSFSRSPTSTTASYVNQNNTTVKFDWLDWVFLRSEALPLQPLVRKEII